MPRLVLILTVTVMMSIAEAIVVLVETLGHLACHNIITNHSFADVG